MKHFNYAIAFVAATLFTAPRRDDDRGASMTEYALLVAAVAAMVAIVSVLFSDKISNFVTGISL